MGAKNECLENAAIYYGDYDSTNGSCGENVNFSLDIEEGRLVISGSGEMANYTSVSKAPWNGFIELIKSVVVEEGVGRIFFLLLGGTDF